jgi:hypothetical protein
VDFADFVLLARVKQNALGNRGFSSVDVGNDADVAGLIERVFAGHEENEKCKIEDEE